MSEEGFVRERWIRAIPLRHSFVHTHVLHLALIGGFVYLPLISPEYFGWILWFLGLIASPFAPGSNVMTVGYSVARIIHRICGFGIIALIIYHFAVEIKNYKKWKITKLGGSLKEFYDFYIRGICPGNFGRYNPGQVLFFWLWIVPIMLLATSSGVILVFKDFFTPDIVSTALFIHDAMFFWGLVGVFHVIICAGIPENRVTLDAMFRTGMMPESYVKMCHAKWYKELVEKAKFEEERTWGE